MRGPEATATRLHLDALTMGDLGAIDEVLAPGFVGHLARSPRDHGAEGLRRLVADVRTAFPDITYRVEHVLRHGDLVAIRVVGTGTHTGVVADVPATGRTASWAEMHVFRFEGGRIAEHWGVVDQLSALQQLGAVPDTVPAMVVDRTVHIDIPDAAYAMVQDYAGYLD